MHGMTNTRIGVPTGAFTRKVTEHLTGQFSRPHGPLGIVAGRIMATRGSNVERNRWLIDQLGVGGGDRLLEVGCGPGVAIETVAARLISGQVIGIDHSTTMLRQAALRNRAAIDRGVVRLVEASAESLTASFGTFDRIYSMNVWQFWPDQEAVIGTLAALLEPGGIVAIGIQPRHRGATAADTSAAARCIADQFLDAGLTDVRAEQLDLHPVPVAGVFGRRPA